MDDASGAELHVDERGVLGRTHARWNAVTR
jgi:hypothetical protein